jgi:hypothetical protein
VELTNLLHTVPRLRMRGATPPLLQYVFIVRYLVKRRDYIIIRFMGLTLTSQREKNDDDDNNNNNKKYTGVGIAQLYSAGLQAG